VVSRGRVNIRVGSSVGGDDYFAEATLRPGTYSFAIASTGNWTVEYSANTEYRSLVDSVSIESSGAMAVDTTWVSSDLHLLRHEQSADVTFVAADGYSGKRIERYSTESWGMAQYDPLDGPFGNVNVTTKRLTGSTLTGNITLTSDQPLFKSGHEGALFQMTSVGQTVSVSVTAVSQFSSHIRVTGADKTEREFQIVITGTWDGTIVVQRSVGEPGSWTTVKGLDFTSNTDETYKDKLVNQIVYYRIGADATPAWTSGTAECSLSYDSGGLNGIVRVDCVFSATESSASVLSALGSTESTELWREGDWSTLRGFPSAVGFHEGRLWWAGKAKVWGSISDAYESFDPEEEGDSGPINRSIATGAVDKIEWLGSLGALIIGAQGREISAKTNSLEAPLTPTNFNLRDVSQQGSAGVQAVKIDSEYAFVQKSQERVYGLGYTTDSVSLTYQSEDMTVLVPEMGRPSIVRMAVQRQPDTRIHCLRSDGTVALLVHDKAEDVAAWIDVETCGTVEDVAVLPSTGEDAVYYLTRRELNDSTGLFLEKWAQEVEARCYPISAYMSLCVDCSDASTSDFIESITVDGQEILGRPVYCQDSNEETATVIAGNLIGANAFDLNLASYDDKFFYTFNESDNMQMLFLKVDGTSFYLWGQTEENLYQYDMTTAWDLSTAFYTGLSFSPSNETTLIERNPIAFSSDGSKLYVMEDEFSGTQKIFQYTLETPWSLETVTYDEKSADFDQLGALTPDIQGITFKNDGTRIYLVSLLHGGVYQVDLTTAWDISTVDFSSDKFFDTTNEDGTPNGVEFHPDGSIMWYIGTVVGDIFEYNLSTAWDISTATYNGVSYDIEAIVGSDNYDKGAFHSFRFSPNGCDFFIADECHFKGVYQLDIAAACGTPSGPCVVTEAASIVTCTS
jgi:hypothetical protein